MFNAIDDLLAFSGKVGKADPQQHGAGNMVTLDARFSTLVLPDAGDLFDFPVKLLDFPAHIANVQEWLGHVNTAATRMYDRRKMRPEDSPTFNIAY